MKKRIAVNSLLCAFLVTIISCTLSNYGNNANKLKSPLEIVVNSDIIAVNHWYYHDDDFICIVTKHRNEDSIPYRRLTIYKNIGSEQKEVLKMETADSFHSMFTTNTYNKNLATIWETGSAVHLILLTYDESQVIPILDIGSRYMPEFADINNDGLMDIIVSCGGWSSVSEDNFMGHPESATIYTFRNDTIIEKSGIPWNERLCNRYDNDQKLDTNENE